MLRESDPEWEKTSVQMNFKMDIYIELWNSDIEVAILWFGCRDMLSNIPTDIASAAMGGPFVIFSMSFAQVEGSSQTFLF